MKVITLNQKVFSKKCEELTSKLTKKPQLIFGILRGGIYVINEIKKQNIFDVNDFKYIQIKNAGVTKNNNIIKFFFKLLPYKVLNRLRILQSKYVKKSIKKLNVNALLKHDIYFKTPLSLKKSIQTILIFDDSIDTGKTMFIVKNNLSKQFPNAQIYIAVISWTLEDSIIKPDYYIFKNILVRFPWSIDYKKK